MATPYIRIAPSDIPTFVSGWLSATPGPVQNSPGLSLWVWVDAENEAQHADARDLMLKAVRTALNEPTAEVVLPEDSLPFRHVHPVTESEFYMLSQPNHMHTVLVTLDEVRDFAQYTDALLPPQYLSAKAGWDEAEEKNFVRVSHEAGGHQPKIRKPAVLVVDQSAPDWNTVAQMAGPSTRVVQTTRVRGEFSLEAFLHANSE